MAGESEQEEEMRLGEMHVDSVQIKRVERDLVNSGGIACTERSGSNEAESERVERKKEQRRRAGARRENWLECANKQTRAKWLAESDTRSFSVAIAVTPLS